MKPVVVICCFCQRIRGDLGPEGGAGLWYEPHLYLTTHNLGAEDFQVSQAYCPSCLTMYRQKVLSATPRHDPQTGKELPYGTITICRHMSLDNIVRQKLLYPSMNGSRRNHQPFDELRANGKCQ